MDTQWGNDAIEKFGLSYVGGWELQEGFYAVEIDPVDYKQTWELREIVVSEEQKIQEAKNYLDETDWVKDYKLRHDLDMELIPEDSAKWDIIAKREEYLVYLRG